MLKALGDFTGALFSLFMAILWGGMGWYLDDIGIAPKSAVYSLYALAGLALLGALLGLLRANAKAKQSTAGLSSAKMSRARESEDELVARMVAKLNAANGAEPAAPPTPTAASIPIVTENDEIVARVLRKLEAEKAAQEAAKQA
ncbi:MAG: hypothetical protein RLZZ58_346 [Pseudomonadota bacterium]